MAWRPHRHNQATVALQQEWKNLGLLYAFPSFSLTGQVFLRVREEELTMILVTPNWPTQPWYSQILQLYKTEPVLLSQSHERLVDPKGSSTSTFSRASTFSSVEQDLQTNGLEKFRKNMVEKGISNKSAHLTQIPEDQVLQLITNRTGKHRLAGIVKDRLHAV